LKTIPSAAALEPGPFVRLLLARTGAKVDSIGFDVRRWIQPAFPPTDEFVRVAGQHDLLPIGAPMSVEDADATLTAADRAAVD